MNKKVKGITLISLVITIIVLIILSSIGIYLSLGNNGIFTKAKKAKELTNKQEATEKINLKITTAQMNKYADEQRMPTLKELSEVLKEDDEILYVTETSQIASKKYEVGENPSSIYTKLNNYPYEFEINSSLQLASINGVKIANTQNNNLEREYGYFNKEEINNVQNNSQLEFEKIEGNIAIDETNNKISLKAGKHYYINFSVRTYDESDYGLLIIYNVDTLQEIKQISWAGNADWNYNASSLIYTPTQDIQISVKATTTGDIHYLRHVSLSIFEI